MYRQAFIKAKNRLLSWEGAAASADRKPARHLAPGAVDLICLLSEEGDILPSGGQDFADDARKGAPAPKEAPQEYLASAKLEPEVSLHAVEAAGVEICVESEDDGEE